MSDLPLLSVQELNKSFGDLEVLQNVSFDLEEFETIAIIGHSGCGKTTLLRIICAFEEAGSGTVLLDGEKHNKPSKDALMLFQSFDQLQPWRTVLSNITYPLIATGTVKDRNEAKKLALKRIADVGLTDFAKAYPHTLSGGMKQRAAVARALALAPRVLLLDEPFASLDNITRSMLQSLTLRVCEKYGISMLLVTHSVEEAVVMADKIIVMDRKPGRIKALLTNHVKSVPLEQRAEFTSEVLDLLGSQDSSLN